MQDRKVTISKFLSLVLRHKPEQVAIELDSHGWVPVMDLLKACNSNGFLLSREELEEVVATSDKRRFSFSQDGQLIRANQGHSVEVELGYEAAEPPEVLFHGTAERFLDSIRREGLVRGRRQHVHLSKDVATAIKVGQRHGKAVVLEVASGEMHRGGYSFHLSENGVWLTERVPPEYIRVAV